VGLLPPLLSIVAWALATKRHGALRALGVPSGLAIWAGVVALWLVPAALQGGAAYLETLVVKQNVTRYAEPWHHFQPWYYYLETLPADFFPWSFFVPGAVWIGARRIVDERRRGFGLMLAWVVVTLLFFSLSPAKRTVYILTLYPALAALVALALTEIESSFASLRSWATVPAALLAALTTLVPLAAWGVLSFAPERLERPMAELRPLGEGWLPLLALIALLLAAGAQAALLLAHRGRVRRSAQALVLAMGALAVVTATLLLPRFDAVKSARPVAAKLVALASPDEPYAIWPNLDATILAYSRRFAVELPDREALYAFARRPQKVWLLIGKDDLARLPERLPLVEVTRDDRRKDGYVILTSER
jgi:4-amino-4-deoxy-L-arabinose transferase-like glycosyltransferase